MYIAIPIHSDSNMILFQDKDHVDLDLAAADMGIQVFQHGSKINTFSWWDIKR